MTDTTTHALGSMPDGTCTVMTLDEVLEFLKARMLARWGLERQPEPQAEPEPCTAPGGPTEEPEPTMEDILGRIRALVDEHQRDSVEPAA